MFQAAVVSITESIDGILQGGAPVRSHTNVSRLPALLSPGIQHKQSHSTSNPTFTADELKYQLDLTKAKAIIVHPSNLLVALEAARAVGIPPEYIVVFDVPGLASGSQTTINEIIGEGMTKPLSFTERRLNRGEARTKLAFLSMSSGTTGKPKVSCTSVPAGATCSYAIQFTGSLHTPHFPNSERHYDGPCGQFADCPVREEVVQTWRCRNG